MPLRYLLCNYRQDWILFWRQNALTGSLMQKLCAIYRLEASLIYILMFRMFHQSAFGPVTNTFSPSRRLMHSDQSQPSSLHHGF